MTPSEIQSRINNAKALDFGIIFNESIELFKKSWLYGFMLQLFTIIISLPFIIILYIPLILLFVAESQDGQFETNEFNTFFAGFSILYILFFILGILTITVIQLAMNASFFRILRRLDTNQEVKITDLFYYVKGKYVSTLFLLMIMAIVISIIATLLCFLPIIYAMIPISFFTIMFAFNPELNVGDIVKLSFNLGTKKWLISFGLFFVANLVIMILTMLTCGLGSIFLAPFIYHPSYIIYKEVVGFDDSNLEA